MIDDLYLSCTFESNDKCSRWDYWRTKKENKIVVMPVRFLNGEKEINSKSFPFSFETRKKMIESVFSDSVIVSSNYTFFAPFKKYFPHSFHQSHGH